MQWNNPGSRGVAVALAALMLQACAATSSSPDASDLVRGTVGETPAPFAPASAGGARAEIVLPDETPVKKRAPNLTQLGRLPLLPSTRETPPRPVTTVQPSEDVVQLDHDQVELRAVMEDIADALGISLVIDPSIADTVTLRTAPDRPLRHADLWPLLRLLMDSAGVTLERRGSVYHAKKQNPSIPMEIGTLDGFSDASGAMVMQITPLRHATLEAALTVLKPLVEPSGGRILNLANLNMLGIFDTPERLRRVNEMLALIDADPFAHRGIHLYPLKSAKAAEVAKDLNAIVKAVEGATSSFQVISLDRLNAVLVVSPPNRGFSEIDRWIRILDSGEDEGGERVFIYRVKNLSAKSLAATLNAVFKTKEGVAAAAVPKPEIVKPKSAEKPAEAAEAGAAEKIKAVADTLPAQAAPAAPGAVSASLQVSIVADEDTNSLLVRAQPRDYKQLLETIAELDRVPQEVMINVVIAEVTLNETNRFGMDWQALSNAATSSISSITNLTGSTLQGFTLNQSDSRLTMLLNLMDEDGDTRVLSRPSILVRDNQEAVIKVGSEEPVLTSVSSSNTTIGGNTQVDNDIQYRDTGIILTVTPHINEDGIINLEIEQEISQVGSDAGVLGLPRFTNREIKTSAVVRDGSALILGGIIQEDETKSHTGIPGLKDVPGVGTFFSDTKNDIERIELVLIIVPELVDPRDGSEAVMNRLFTRLTGAAQLLDRRGISHELGLR